MSTLCLHICSDIFFTTETTFAMPFWSYCLSLQTQGVMYNFIALVTDEQCWQVNLLSESHVLLFLHIIIFAWSSLNSSIRPSAPQNLFLLARSWGNWWVVTKEILVRVLRGLFYLLLINYSSYLVTESPALIDIGIFGTRAFICLVLLPSWCDESNFLQ